MFLFIVSREELSKILYFDTESEDLAFVSGMSDKKYIDCVVFQEQLICLDEFGILTVYNIIQSKSGRARSSSAGKSPRKMLTPEFHYQCPKIIFHRLIELPRDEAQTHPTWLTVSDNYVLAGTQNSIYKIDLENSNTYSLEIIQMKMAFKNFFNRANEICCSSLAAECANKEYVVHSSTVTSQGTYYLIREKGGNTNCSFIVFYNEQSMQCQQMDADKNIIKIQEHNDHVYAFVRVEDGFYISKFTETHGLVTKHVHSFVFPDVTTLCIK